MHTAACRCRIEAATAHARAAVSSACGAAAGDGEGGIAGAGIRNVGRTGDQRRSEYLEIGNVRCIGQWTCTIRIEGGPGEVHRGTGLRRSWQVGGAGAGRIGEGPCATAPLASAAAHGADGGGHACAGAIWTTCEGCHGEGQFAACAEAVVVHAVACRIGPCTHEVAHARGGLWAEFAVEHPVPRHGHALAIACIGVAQFELVVDGAGHDRAAQGVHQCVRVEPATTGGDRRGAGLQAELMAAAVLRRGRCHRRALARLRSAVEAVAQEQAAARIAQFPEAVPAATAQAVPGTVEQEERIAVGHACGQAHIRGDGLVVLPRVRSACGEGQKERIVDGPGELAAIVVRAHHHLCGLTAGVVVGAGAAVRRYLIGLPVGQHRRA